MMMLYPLMEAVRSGGDLENLGGDGKYTKTIVCPDGCVIFKLTAKPLGNENFHKGGFSPYSTSLFVTKNKSDLYSINSLNGEIREESCYHSFNNSRSTTGIIAAWNVIQSVAIEGFQSYIANALKVSDVLSKNSFATSSKSQL